jgi:heme A synthase
MAAVAPAPSRGLPVPIRNPSFTDPAATTDVSANTTMSAVARIAEDVGRSAGVDAPTSRWVLKAGIAIVIIATIVGAMRSTAAIIKASHAIAQREPLADDADDATRQTYAVDSFVKYMDVTVAVIAALFFITFAVYSLWKVVMKDGK